MNILSEAHKKLLLDLLTAGVDFMLIGGYAVNYHGYPRYTADMDIWLKPNDENRIDFLTKISGVQFSEAFPVCAKLPLADKEIPVIQYQHLIINKMLSSRPKDKADVDELTKINRFKKSE